MLPMRVHTLLPAIAVLGLIHLPAFAQTRPVPGPLNGVCGGAWNEVNDAIMSLRRLRGIETRQVQEKVTCLLAAISTARFDAHDRRWSDFLAGEDIHLLVGVYGPEGYDFFASQIPIQADLVRRALTGTLMLHGHPDAVVAYFASRRAGREKPDEGLRAVGASTLFGSLIERGECAEPICSKRVNETLRIVSENLDVVESDLLKASEAPSPEQRQRASDLLQIVQRVRRGEATVGHVR